MFATTVAKFKQKVVNLMFRLYTLALENVSGTMIRHTFIAT